jgi:hypothetical protein
MILRLLRFASGEESTLGALYVVDPLLKKLRFLCFTLEDQFQTQKVYSETRIPPGMYDIGLRRHGGFHERYKARYPEFHVGMLEILDVHGFTDILIHCGNTDDDTAGCLLVGDTLEQNATERGHLGSSRAAYERIYPAIAAADGNLFLQIFDYA